MANDTSDRIAMWQTYVQSAENTNSQREAINRYMIPIHLAIFASYLVLDVTGYIYAWIGIAGGTIAALWAILLESHARINYVKYDIICNLESDLPCQPFTQELKPSVVDTLRRKYPSLTIIQLWGAGVVVIVHCVIVVGSYYWW